MNDLDRDDWFSVYIKTHCFDPHTNYFAPEEKERFDVSMSGKLEGIGARLQKKMISLKFQNFPNHYEGKQLGI
jgi:carboxyl-terminal processing protease